MKKNSINFSLQQILTTEIVGKKISRFFLLLAAILLLLLLLFKFQFRALAGESIFYCGKHLTRKLNVELFKNSIFFILLSLLLLLLFLL